MKRMLLLVLVAILTFVLVGCGSKEELDGTVELDLSISEREGTIGKSEKDFTIITKSSPGKVREDTTGKWRKITTSTSEDTIDYMLSYNKLHMTEETTVHAIVNFANKTTTMINDFESYLSVKVHEYVEKEELDANKLGSGMVLGEYNIYKDNGDIVKID